MTIAHNQMPQWKKDLSLIQQEERLHSIDLASHSVRQRTYRKILEEIVVSWYIDDLKVQKEDAFQRLNGKSKKKFSAMTLGELQALKDLLAAKLKLRKIRKRVLGLHAFKPIIT